MKCLFILFTILHFCLYSQKELTVQECLDLGIKNEKLILTQLSAIDRSNINYQFGKLSLLPTINTNTSFNINFGRKLDPFTNQFGIQSAYSNSYGLSAQMNLFQGLKYFKQNRVFELNIAKSKIDLEKNIEKVKNQILEKCFAIWKVQLKIEQQNKIISNLTAFKERQTELVNEGRLSAIDTLVTLINIKTQNVTLINLKQQLSYETINLNYFLGLPLMDNTKLEPYKPSLVQFELSLDEYFQLEDLKNKLETTVFENKVDQTQFIPILGFFGNIGTGYSTNNKDYGAPNTPIIPFSTQIPNNAYQGIGFTLNIPIFNKFEWYKKQRLYEINISEQNELIKLKELEIDKKKLELQSQKQYLDESLNVQKGILKDKETIFQTTQLIYLEGKIRLNEVEKVEMEYYNYIQTIQDLEIELFKLNAIKIGN